MEEGFYESIYFFWLHCPRCRSALSGDRRHRVEEPLMSLHTVRPILFNDAENTERLIADVLVSLRTVEHYNLVARADIEEYDPDLDS
jgi:hypothetical protein